ncbi:MAG: hypothetical protein ACE5E8_11015 [Acidimicrobiia bacterium]
MQKPRHSLATTADSGVDKTMHPLIRRPDYTAAHPPPHSSRRSFLLRLWARITVRGDRGANLAEYGVLLVLIAVLVIGIVASIGDTTAGTYDTVNAGFGS